MKVFSYYDSIYLSPHLDDVVLSCGGQIYQEVQAGNSVLVVTVTAGDPPNIGLSGFAQSLHKRWKTPSEAVATRRTEDILACKLLGADYLHWMLLDCIYRRDPLTNQPIYASEASLFGTLHPGDEAAIQKTCQLIAGLPKWKELFVPLGVGNHVDHQLCRLAAEQKIGHERLFYYEEYPYAQTVGLPEMIAPAGFEWRSKLVPLSQLAFSNKLRAISKYRSQLSTFFTDREDMGAKIERYHRQVGGERLWHTQIVPPRPPNSTLE